MDAMKRLSRMVSGVVLAAGMGVAQAGAVSAPFLVNAGLTSANQFLADTSVGLNGDSLVLFGGPSLPNEYAQRYDTAGVSLAPAAQALDAYALAGATDRAGNFTIAAVGSNCGGGTGLNKVTATVYNRAGGVLTNTYRVDTDSFGRSCDQLVATNASGQTAFVWWNTGTAQTPSVEARVFSRSGVALSSQLLVTTPNSSLMQVPIGIGIDGSGNFTVAYAVQPVHAVQPLNFNVYIRRYSSSGAPLGSAMQVNDSTGENLNPHLAVNDAGNIVVVWNHYQSSDNAWGTSAQIYNASGARVGNNIAVATADGSDEYLDVGMDDTGSFAVAWENDNRQFVASAIPSVFARQYQADGTPVGAVFTVNAPSSTAWAFNPTMGMDPAGNFTIGWQQYNPVTQDYDVYARRYVIDTRPAVATLVDHVAATGLSGAQGSLQYFKVTVPANTPTMQVQMSGAGDADLYIRFAALPTTSRYDIHPGVLGSNETVQINTPPPGEFYIGVYGVSAYSGVSLTASY